MASKTTFLHILLMVHHRHKSGWISLKKTPNITPRLGSLPSENDTGATKADTLFKISSVNIFRVSGIFISLGVLNVSTDSFEKGFRTTYQPPAFIHTR